MNFTRPLVQENTPHLLLSHTRLAEKLTPGLPILFLRNVSREARAGERAETGETPQRGEHNHAITSGDRGCRGKGGREEGGR